MTGVDLTAWCGRRLLKDHKMCGGVLLTATGYHWWCACKCHAETPEPKQGTEHHRAWRVWREARAT